VCNAQIKNYNFFKKNDSLLKVGLGKLYLFDSIKTIDDTAYSRINLNKNLKTKIFLSSTIVKSYHYLINDSNVESQISVIELRFVDSNSCKKAYHLLYKKMGIETWGVFEMITCVKRNANDLVFLYSSNVLFHKVELFIKEFCPNCRCEEILIPPK
jgi:hypothetical protein